MAFSLFAYLCLAVKIFVNIPSSILGSVTKISYA